MKLLKIIQDVRTIFKNEEYVFLQNGRTIEKFGSNQLLEITPFEGTFSNGFIYKKNKDSIDIIDFDFSAYKIDIKDCFGVRIIDYDTIFLNYDFASKECTAIFTEGEIQKINKYFWGAPLNKDYRLNYPEGTFSNPRYFRCSDLLDEATYWEYDCGDGYVASRFYVWNGRLVFSKSKDTDVRLVLIDLATGKIDWDVQIVYGAFFFHKQKGVLVSVWGSQKEGGQYQIIHLDKLLVEIGRLEDFNMEYVRVNWETQFLAGNKYYFTETVNTTGNEKPRPIKFGSFDIETKKIDFLQEVPEAAGGQFAQIIYHDNKLYLRTSANELFIFEDEDGPV